MLNLVGGARAGKLNDLRKFPIPAAYFVLLGLLALTATADPLVAPFLPRKLSETQFHFTVMKIPVLLKVGE